jgi:hypothetical protein
MARRSLITAVVIIGVVASLAIRHWAGLRIRRGNEILARQDIQLNELAVKNAQLSHRLAEAKTDFPGDQTSEFENLRAEVGRLRALTNELGVKLTRTRETRKLLGISSSPSGYDYTPEDWERRDAMAAGKKKDATNLSNAFYDYYRKHQGQFPSNLDQLSPYLAENHLSLTGTNEFEMIYPGPQDLLTNFPTQMLAVVRERHAWLAPSGRWTRVYGMLTVPPRVVESDDNFQSWEAEHIFLSPGAREP